MKLEDHPTVLAIRSQNRPLTADGPGMLDAALIKQMAIEAGADDVGL